MSISSIYILDKKGNILINRYYRGDHDSEAIEKFQKKYLSQSEKSILPYIVDEENNIAYTYLYHANLICLLISFDNFSTELEHTHDHRIF